jgi:hypothetical protein
MLQLHAGPTSVAEVSYSRAAGLCCLIAVCQVYQLLMLSCACRISLRCYTGCATAPSPPTTCTALGMHVLLSQALLSLPEWCIVLVPGPLMVPLLESITDMMPWMRALVPRESPVALFLLPLEPMLCTAA